MLMLNSDGVEISIAGCVQEMVGDANLIPFFSFSFFSNSFFFRCCI